MCSGIWAIGDVVGRTFLAHGASFEGICGHGEHIGTSKGNGLFGSSGSVYFPFQSALLLVLLGRQKLETRGLDIAVF